MSFFCPHVISKTYRTCFIIGFWADSGNFQEILKSSRMQSSSRNCLELNLYKPYLRTPAFDDLKFKRKILHTSTYRGKGEKIKGELRRKEWKRS